jgi:hypothetical protein
MENNPYAPSASSLAGGSEGVNGTQDAGFRDLSGITRTVSVLLLIGLGVKVLAIVSAYMQLNLLSHAPYSVAAARANDLRENVVGSVQLLLYLITVIVFGRWIYLAHQNLPDLGARYLRFTPGWSVGCFFVPIMNLWAPYQAMRELAKASRTPRQWELEDSPPLIFIWWILWLILQVLGNAVIQGGLHRKTLADLQMITTLDIASGLLSVPHYLLALYIVRRVSRDQSSTYAEQVGVSAV